MMLNLKPLNLVHLLCALSDDLTLLAYAHSIQVCWAEAKLLVKMRGEEARGTHMISCLFMIPILGMILLINRHLPDVIFLLEIFHFCAPSYFSYQVLIVIQFKLVLESHRAVQFPSMIWLSLHGEHLGSGEIITWRLHKSPQVTHRSRIRFSAIGQ